jgi:transcriptional regulatory protein RtcR
MATLAEGGRIAEADVAAETARLRAAWRGGAREDGLDALLGERAAALDRFDRVQLADVIAVCAAAPSLSAAGRVLFAQSREDKASRNDADRLRKYLARFALTFDAIRAHGAA